jgi:pSer/pThr/pTyr-binding forkhead associated (FHA) protein
MPRLIITLDGLTLRDVQLNRERTTIGRRPHNDLVIDNLAVSGDHAAILRGPAGSFLEDLGSTNGTFLNGRAVQRAPLQHQDSIDIGKYRLRYIDEVPTADFERTMLVRSGSSPSLSPSLAHGATSGSTPGSTSGSTPGLTLSPSNGTAPTAPRDVAAGGFLRAPLAIPRHGASPPPLAASAAPPAPAAEAPPARVKVVSGGAVGRELQLVKVVTTIGRPGGAIAAITRRGGSYTLAHVEGAPATRLNGTEIQRQPVSLSSGDQLDLSGVVMEFLID